jgi:4-hydroxy-3-polyprenylbenzoate decarboxylase
MVWQEEIGCSFNETLVEWQEHPSFVHYPINDLRAPIASGTYPAAGMALVPASMNSIASLANGISNNLLLRAADVCLKERRPLVFVPRETPLHSIHLENMLTLSRMGAVILPPDPAFYLKPQNVDDIVRYVINKVLVALRIEKEMPQDLQYGEGS